MGLIDEFRQMKTSQKRGMMLFCLVAALPMMAVIAMQTEESIAAANSKASLASDPDAEWAAALASRVEPVRMAASDRHALDLLLGHRQVHADRRLVLALDTPLVDFRAGAKPGKKDRKARLAAAEQAVQSVAKAECERLMRSFAADCRVVSASGKMTDEERYTYSIQLAFAEKTGPGKTKAEGNLAFRIDRVSLTDPALRARTGIEKAGEMREKIYAELARQCDRLRKAGALCSINSISMSAVMAPGLPMIATEATAGFSTLSPVTESAPAS